MSLEKSPAAELAVIINSFNRRDLLERALGSLLPALRELPFESVVIVYEVGSTDGSRELLAEVQRTEPRLRVLMPAAGDDTSFSAGVNEACRTAIAEHPAVRWLFLYETDNWISGPQPLLAARTLLLAEEKLGAAGFTVRLHAGVRCGYGMRFPTARGFVAGQNASATLKLDGPNPGRRRTTSGVEWFTCDVVFTSPLLIRREAWEAAGGFDAAAFPFSDSDLDWAWRCARLGWRMAVIESDAVVHDNLAVSSAWSANRVVDLHRSRMRLLKRHRGPWIGALKPLLWLRHLAEAWLLARSDRPGDDTRLAKRREMIRTVWRDYRA